MYVLALPIFLCFAYIVLSVLFLSLTCFSAYLYTWLINASHLLAYLLLYFATVLMDFVKNFGFKCAIQIKLYCIVIGKKFKRGKLTLHIHMKEVN